MPNSYTKLMLSIAQWEALSISFISCFLLLCLFPSSIYHYCHFFPSNRILWCKFMVSFTCNYSCFISFHNCIIIPSISFYICKYFFPSSKVSNSNKFVNILANSALVTFSCGANILFPLPFH